MRSCLPKTVSGAEGGNGISQPRFGLLDRRVYKSEPLASVWDQLYHALHASGHSVDIDEH